ncbi:hypothetical protein MMC25_002110 [Agyrium rufum]|nr:hypothetical protein [Agyrium rufum]
MRVFSSQCTFNYPWEEVSTANWRKYCPWNDKSTHVIAVDTISRSVDQASGILRTERLITCHQTAPAWVTALLGGSNTSQVLETSYVDPIRKTVTMSSTNLSWSNLLSVRETVTYQALASRPSGASSSSKPETTEKTQFSQEATIVALAGGWQKIKTKIEEASVERFQQNAVRGREGFEHVLEMSRRVFGEERNQERDLQRA